MEHKNDAAKMLDLMGRPAFCVTENKIIQVNAGAAGLGFSAGDALSDLISTGGSEYAAFEGSCLYLTLSVNGERLGASVTRMDEFDVFCLEELADSRELQAMALAARELREPLSSVMITAQRLFPLSALADDPATQEQVARLIGKSQSAVANKLRILRHSPEVLQALRDGELSERHGRALLKLTTEEEKLAAIEVIVQQAMSVARTEKYIAQLLVSSEPKETPVNVGAFLNGLSQSLARIQSSGIPAISERRETEDRIVLTITIPK